MARDLMLIEFLKKESATQALILMLTMLDIVRYRSRPFRVEPMDFWVSSHDIKNFTTRWVKRNCDDE